MNKALRVLITLLFVVLAAAVLWRIQSGKKEMEFREEETRESVAELVMESKAGSFRLADFEGQLILIDVWASWCGPCIRAVPELIQLQSDFSPDLKIVGLNVDEAGWPAVEVFRAAHPEINYLIARLVDQPILQWNTIVNLPIGPVSALPTAFLLDRKGRLVAKYVGSGQKAKIRRDLKRLTSS